MQAHNINRMFDGLTFRKTAQEITDAAKTKILSLMSKIEERQRRVTRLREEHAIDDAALVQLLTAARKQAGAQTYSYSTKAINNADRMEERTIGAGVVNNLLTENDFIEAERDQIKRLELISRNLKPERRFTSNGDELPDDGYCLSYEELRYLNF